MGEIDLLEKDGLPNMQAINLVLISNLIVTNHRKQVMHSSYTNHLAKRIPVPPGKYLQQESITQCVLKGNWYRSCYLLGGWVLSLQNYQTAFSISEY